jgi:hypothetical protein
MASLPASLVWGVVAEAGWPDKERACRRRHCFLLSSRGTALPPQLSQGTQPCAGPASRSLRCAVLPPVSVCVGGGGGGGL